MKILNNESVIYEGVRYIGLTIPVALAKRKKELQNFIAIELKRLLAQDKTNSNSSCFSCSII
jgi:hypothetical protein